MGCVFSCMQEIYQHYYVDHRSAWEHHLRELSEEEGLDSENIRESKKNR